MANDNLIKVLVITNSYPTFLDSMPGVYVKRQVESLREASDSFDITVFYNPIFRFLKNPTLKKGLFWNGLKYLVFTLWFIPILFKKFDIVHAHQCFYPGLLGYIYRIFHHSNFIITSHGGDIDGMAKASSFIKYMMIRSYEKADHIIAVSTEYQSRITNEFGIKKKINVIPCGTDFDLFRADTPKKDDYIPLTPRLLFVGNLIDSKNPQLLLEAIKTIKDRTGVLLEAIIIGEGDLQGTLEEFGQRNDLKLNFTGNLEQKELPSFFTTSSILIFPSRHEGFGLVGVEALACGVPVIASRVGGIKDYLIENENGLFFEPGNLEDLIDKITKLIENQSLYLRLQANARNSVLKYSLQNTAQKISDLYLDYRKA